MYIKQLEVDNFKSFANKVEIPMLKGFTTISGPNGSGKSTIIDSDGIIYSEVFIPANGMRYGKVVQLDEVEMSKEERENRISELYNFSNNYNEQNEFDELLARGERVYAEASRKMRDVIAEYLGRYEEVLGTGKLAKIKQEAEVLKKFLDVCERG